MSTTASPFGAWAVYHPSGTIRPKTFFPSTIPSAACYKGDLVKLTGDAAVLAISAANDASFGVFDGCEYTDATGTPIYSPYWPASLSGVTNIKWHIIPFDPGMIFEIQGGSGSWANTAIGDSADVVVAAGNVNTGVSGSYLNATLKGAAAVGNFRIIGLSNAIDQSWSDSYPILQVEIAKNQILTEVNSI